MVTEHATILKNAFENEELYGKIKNKAYAKKGT